jgi:hypothetical protein
LFHGVAHGGQIDYARDSGEILQEDAAGSEGDFLVWLGLAIPVGERADFFFGDVAAIFGAQQVLQQNAERKR